MGSRGALVHLLDETKHPTPVRPTRPPSRPPDPHRPPTPTPDPRPSRGLGRPWCTSVFSTSSLVPSDVSHAYSPVAVEGGRIRFLWRKRDRSKRLLPDASNGVKQGLKA